MKFSAQTESILHGLEHGARDGLIQIWVPGEPRVYPKLSAMPVMNKRGQIIKMRNVPIDWRTRKNPITGRVEKYDKGYKRRWMNEVARAVKYQMTKNGIKPFEAKHPLALGLLFFITKAPSCKLEFPSQDPDYDNFCYAIWNTLSASKKQAAVLWYDDNQIIFPLWPAGLLWATEDDPPGVLITCQCIHRRLGRECSCSTVNTELDI